MFASSLECLAKIVALSRFDWKEVHFGMFVSCFDASGTTHDQRYLVMAGYVSSANDWIAFDREWQERLREDGIAYFHRAECQANRDQFHGWREKTKAKDNLLRDLIAIIKSHTYRKFGCMLSNKIVESKLSSKVKKNFHLHAYALTGIISLGQAYRWAHENKIRTPKEWIFEDGDTGKGELIKCMELHGYPAPLFRGKRDRRDKNGGVIPAFTGLQAADFLAYEMFQWLKTKKESVYLHLLREQVGEPFILTVKSIEELDQFLTQVGNYDDFVARLEMNT